MKKLTRRQAIDAAITGGVGLGMAPTSLFAAGSAQTVKAHAGRHEPKPLPFDPAKLNGISERIIRSHWENNYGGAVRALNAVELRLASLISEKDLPPYIFGDLKREELARTGSVTLHEHYFGNLGGDGKPGGAILQALREGFGSVEQWEVEFKKTGAALAGGSGWTILALNFQTGELRNYWAWDHLHNAPFTCPLLVLDMYEHSYHMDFGAAANRYIEAFMLNIRWEEVDRRYTRAMKAITTLKA